MLYFVSPFLTVMFQYFCAFKICEKKVQPYRRSRAMDQSNRQEQTQVEDKIFKTYVFRKCYPPP